MEKATSFNNNIKLLLVEDNIDHQELIIWSLKEHYPKIDITVVEQGGDCLKYCKKISFDMILLDFNLPDMDGLDVLRTLKKRNDKTPVIFITGIGSEKTAIEALRLGAYDYIGKIGNYFETLPVVIQQNMEKYNVNMATEVLKKQIEEKDIQLTALRDKIKKLSLTDTLTGLYNQRCFLDKLAEELKRSKRYTKPLSCMLIDIDNCKDVYSMLGHHFGDYILRTISQLFRESLRETNFIARYGDDEFAIILPNTDIIGAEVIAQRILTRIANYEFTQASHSTRLTISIGIASFPSDTTSPDSSHLVTLTSKALDTAKSSGKNCYRRYRHYPSRSQENDNLQDLQNQVSIRSLEIKSQMLDFISQFLSTKIKNRSDLFQHSSKVREFAGMLSRELNLPEVDREILDCAAVIHDIGMLGIAPEVFDKPGKLTSEEVAVIKRHPMMSADLLNSVKMFSKELPIVLHHHEHYDGSGYPYGMKGRKIPTGSRVLAIVDAYESMISGRIYKKQMSPEAARRELLLNAGTQFDPSYTNTFIRLVSEVEQNNS